MTQTEVPIEVELRGLYKAHYRFQFLSAGFQLGLFALVEKEPGLAVREIAARLDLKEQPTRILLLGCTVFGLLCKDGEGYHTTPLSKPLTANFDESPASNIPWEQHGKSPQLLLPHNNGFGEPFVQAERCTGEIINVRAVAEQTVRRGRQDKRPDLGELDVFQCSAKGFGRLGPHEGHSESVQVR